MDRDSGLAGIPLIVGKLEREAAEVISQSGLCERSCSVYEYVSMVSQCAYSYVSFLEMIRAIPYA